MIENGSIIKEYSTLVNPETYFNSFNIELTGISPKAVENSPTFPQLWKTIEGMMNSGVLVAYNASFDMKVLANCINDYNIQTINIRKYLCTVQMGRKCYPELPNHKLDTLCCHLGIELDHHKADSDSTACAKLFLDYIKKGLKAENFIRTYDLAAMKTVYR